MPLGSPELLDTFMLGPYQLKANAPQSMKIGVKASFRFFFRKNGPTGVQKGRVTPKPITLQFQYNGVNALQAAVTLKQMAEKQDPITLSWAKAVHYDGYLTDFDFDFAQKLVTGTLTYQPTRDLLQDPADSSALTADFAATVPVMDTEDVQNVLGGLLGFLAGVLALVDGLAAMIDEGLGELYSFLEAAQDAVDAVNTIINRFGDILNTPFLVLDEAWSIVKDALDLLPAAQGTLKAKFFDPAIPLLTGIQKDLGLADAQAVACGLDDAETNLNLLAAAVKPPTGAYIVQDGDSLFIIADQFDTSVDALLSLNPGLTPETLAAGQTMQVPADASQH